MQVEQDIKTKAGTSNPNNILFKPDMNKFYQDNLPENNNFNMNTTSMLNRSSMMTYSKIICCICSATIEANAKGMCETCARSEISITDGIIKNYQLSYCKGCDRYLRPPWVRCGISLESPEIMQLCLSKIKGLSKVKLVDTSFVWTEPHSKIIKIKLTVQKEMNKNLVESSFIVEYKVDWTQCDDCKKTFTPHIWNASVQIRQKVAHKRTFMYLEQIVLKNKAHTKALNVKELPEGVDFYFANKSQALQLTDFIKTVLPSKIKQSKQLIGQDLKSNIAHYKYSFMIELAPVSKEDLIVIDKELSKELGGIGPVLLCHKMSSRIHLIDPLTFNTYDYDASSYWRYEFKSYVDRKVLEEFMIINVEEEIDYGKKYANMSVITASNDVEMNESDSKVNQSKSTNYKNVPNKSSSHSHHPTYYNNNHNQFKIVTVQCIALKHGENTGSDNLITTRSHLGGKIHIGDIFLGYNLKSLNINEELEGIMTKADSIPDVILVKKKYVRKENNKRHWKLKHLDKDVDMTKKDKVGNGDAQYEEFLRDIEEDKDMRKNVNLYKDDDVLKELEGKFKNLKVNEKDDSDIDIKVEELLDDLTLNDKEENHTAQKKESVDFNDAEQDHEEEVDTFVKPNNVNVNSTDYKRPLTGAGNKKQIGKRERGGKLKEDESD
jgi:nonsense-mediated mRNA decay protein 3